MKDKTIDVSRGIVSYCTGNLTVIDNLLKIYKKIGKVLLVEATANQVNQFGGYTGMTPKKFAEKIHNLARKNNFPENLLILGGDHLGPLTWKNKEADQAMSLAKDLVHDFVEAGFQKIHLDTSMKLADDDKNGPLSLGIIAQRGCDLFIECETTAAKYGYQCIYTIGSEVPIPGGEVRSQISVTCPNDVKATITEYSNAFKKNIVANKNFSKVKAIVVQPGVEFSLDTKINFDPEKAKSLCELLQSELTQFVYEGHSTDYQTKASLKAMVKNGVKILKVGPALTYAYRCALIRLECLEHDIKGISYSNFSSVLKQTMIAEPKYWESYYSQQMDIDHSGSYLDRERYYLSDSKVERCINILKQNIDTYAKESLLYKWFPNEFESYSMSDGSFFDFVIQKSIENEVCKYESAID